jgi:membrane associated rhomboid family serine protease
LPIKAPAGRAPGARPSPFGGGDPGASPLDRTAAVQAVQQADELMEASEPDKALPLYQMASSFTERDVAAAGFFGVGNALYRLDRESEAREAWERATSFGETPVSYRAWRLVAAALVREGDLPGALRAYRECERRAPREDRAEISSRLGWLNKETGNTRAAGRYFARSRGDSLPAFMTYLIIAVTVAVSLIAMSGSGAHSPLGSQLEQQLLLNKYAVAHGELYRLLSVVLVHDPSDILHLLFNMYALWYAGQLVERMYGSAITFAMYVLCGVAGSVGTYVLSVGPGAAYSVGASGAIFGLFGVVLVATRLHHAVLDAQSRMIASQVGFLIVLNLVLGFSGVFNVDNFAHVGGLAAGLWLGLIIPPGQVPTLASLWQAPRGGASPASQATVTRLLGVGALVAVVGVAIAIGTSEWQDQPGYRYFYGLHVPAQPALVVSSVPAPTRVELVIG